MNFRFTKGHAVAVKLCAMSIVAGLQPFIGLLKPLQKDNIWPTGIGWTVTIIFAVVAIANVWIAFTSASFQEWMDEKKQKALESTPTPEIKTP